MGHAEGHDQRDPTLLAEEGLGKDYVRHPDEWTRNLAFLLGIHDRQQADRCRDASQQPRYWSA